MNWFAEQSQHCSGRQCFWQHSQLEYRVVFKHLQVVAKTRFGKSNIVKFLIAQKQTVMFDPQKGSTSREAFRLECDRGEDCILEDLDDLERGLPVNLSFDTERQREEVIDSIMARRGGNIDESPLLEQGMQNWMQLVGSKFRMKKALRVFNDTAVQDEAMMNCSQDVFQWWDQVPVNPISRERWIGPAQRALGILGRTFLEPRIQNKDHVIEALRQGYSIFFEGGEQVSEAEMKFWYRLVSNKILRWKSQEGSAPLTIVYEEAGWLESIRAQEKRYLMGLAKRGVRIIIVTQVPFYSDKETTEAVMQNTDLVIGRCESDVAETMAKAILPLIFDPHNPKITYERMVQMGDKAFIEQRHEFYGVGEYSERIKGVIMNLPLGRFIVKNGNEVTVIDVPLFESRTRNEAQRRKECPWLVQLNSGEEGGRPSWKTSSQGHSQTGNSQDSSTSPAQSWLPEGLFGDENENGNR